MEDLNKIYRELEKYLDSPSVSELKGLFECRPSIIVCFRITDIAEKFSSTPKKEQKVRNLLESYLKLYFK